MNDLFQGLKFMYWYKDNLLSLTKNNWNDQSRKLELNLTKLKERKLKCNIEKSLFGQTEMEYLGFWVTREGVRPLNKN